MEPTTYAWIVPGRLAVAERPGGAGRSHRRVRRAGELDWWRAQGVVAIVSGLRTRHGLDDYLERGFVVRWHPLRDLAQASQELPEMVESVRGLLQDSAGTPRAVLVHCDMANEWLAGVDARLRLALGLSRTPRAALRSAAADGLPVGSLATSIAGSHTSAAA